MTKVTPMEKPSPLEENILRQFQEQMIKSQEKNGLSEHSAMARTIIFMEEILDPLWMARFYRKLHEEYLKASGAQEVNQDNEMRTRGSEEV